MSSQLDSLSFIKEGSTRRKEILAKFLDLDIFERKFKMAQEDSADLKGLIRRVGETNYDNDIALAEVQCEEGRKELDNEVKVCALERQNLSAAQLEYIALTDQIESIPAERLDIVSLLELKSSLGKKIEETNLNIVELKQEVIGYDEKLKDYDDFLTTIDIEELLEKKKQHDEFTDTIFVL